LAIAIVFDTITDLYADNKGKQLEFIVTFNSMLKDLIDTMEDDNNLSSSEERKLAILNYLAEIVQEFIDDNNISDEEFHTAPNGKIYVIVRDDNKSCYTSPNFLVQNKCFPSLVAMKKHIDDNNLAWKHTVDTSRSTPIFVAPNMKMYTILKTTDGRYFSYRFVTPRYFNSLKDTQNYINANNRKNQRR